MTGLANIPNPIHTTPHTEVPAMAEVPKKSRQERQHKRDTLQLEDLYDCYENKVFDEPPAAANPITDSSTAIIESSSTVHAEDPEGEITYMENPMMRSVGMPQQHQGSGEDRLAAREKDLQAREETVHKKEEQIKAAKEAVDAKYKQIQEKDDEIKEKDDKIKAKDEEIQQLRETLGGSPYAKRL